MPLSDLIHQPLVTVPATAPAAEAARLMRHHHVGALAVTDGAGERSQLVGLVTDRDLALEVLGQGSAAGPSAPAARPVGAIASTALVAAPADAGLDAAADTMLKHAVRRLLVVDHDGRVLGLVSADDLLQAMARQLSVLAEALRAGVLKEPERHPEPPPPAAPHPVFLPIGTPGMPLPRRLG